MSDAKTAAVTARSKDKSDRCNGLMSTSLEVAIVSHDVGSAI
jgi:hypothetical protein